MKFGEALAQDRRLATLKLINEAGGAANESVLRQGLEMLGYMAGMTYQTVRDDLRFLEEAGCVKVDWFDDRVAIAKITRRGVDCAAGQIRVEGVKRPSIGL
jgi:Fe2+ or Zn2+ uptake regulation protein